MRTVKVLRILLGEQVLVDVPGIPGGQFVISFQQGVFAQTIAIKAELRIAGSLVDAQLMNANMPPCPTEVSMKTEEPAPELPKSEWLSEKEVCQATGLTIRDLNRLSHHLDKQRSIRGSEKEGVLYSRLSVGRLMRLYKLPHKRFLPMPPDLSSEESWPTTFKPHPIDSDDEPLAPAAAESADVPEEEDQP